MINNDYIVDMDWCKSGGYCDFLPIKDEPLLGFKHFQSKIRAEQTLANQKILSRFDLAPNPVTEVCKIPYYYDLELLRYWIPDKTVTEWGYVTEKAETIEEYNHATYKQIQDLVDNIEKKTSLKFWDCHIENIGIVKRGKTKKIVCIDTGNESFTHYCNAWGGLDPGPRCAYCMKYNCKNHL